MRADFGNGKPELLVESGKWTVRTSVTTDKLYSGTKVARNDLAAWNTTQHKCILITVLLLVQWSS